MIAYDVNYKIIESIGCLFNGEVFAQGCWDSNIKIPTKKIYRLVKKQFPTEQMFKVIYVKLKEPTVITIRDNISSDKIVLTAITNFTHVEHIATFSKDGKLTQPEYPSVKFATIINNCAYYITDDECVAILIDNCCVSINEPIEWGDVAYNYSRYSYPISTPHVFNDISVEVEK